VSTEEQGNKGYSLRQQLGVLREYCQQNEYDIVGEFEDRASGAYLTRPGLDNLRELVAEGGVDIVLAQNRDRFTREPAYHYILRLEFREHGCSLKALNDIGDASPEGELSDGVVDLIAKYERARIAGRTSEGRVRKAKEGKIPGSGTPPLGFRYEDGHYYVVEEKMSVVRDIFQRVAEGQSLNEVVRYLEGTGVPTPGGGKWHRTTIRTLIFNEAYDGVYYYGKTRKRRVPSTKIVGRAKTYGYRTETKLRPKEEWIGVPVPDSGVPKETIERARQRIEGNTWTPSNNNGLTWELSGGVGLCGYCGSRLRTRSPNNSTRKYFYYTCLNESCPFNKHYRKQELERRVGELLADTLRPDTWTEFVDRTIDQKIADLKRRHRSPSESRHRLLERVGELQTKLDRTRELYTDGDYLKEEYHEKRDAIQDQITVVQQDLSKLEDLDTGMTRIEFLRHLLMSMTPGVDHTYFGYAGTARGEDKRHLVVTAYPDHPSFFTSSEDRSMVERQEFYRKMNLSVRVRDDDLEVEIATPAISQSEDPS
jgi:site-specific DNA recombinase